MGALLIQHHENLVDLSLTSLVDAVNSNHSSTAIYGEIVRLARTPELYRILELHDHALVRFELLCIMLCLTLYVLKSNHQKMQELADLFVIDMDACVRDLPVGDLKVGRQVKRLVQSFYGRLKTYEAVLQHHQVQELVDILERNLFVHSPKTPPAFRQHLANIILSLFTNLKQQIKEPSYAE